MLGQNALSKALGSVDHPLLRALRYLLVLALLVGWYFFAAQIGLVLRVYYGDITPLWPPSGIALALLWRYGLQWWPVIVVGEFCVALSLAQPPHMGLVGGIAQSLEALTATLLLTRLRVEQTLSKPTQVSLFVVVGALLPPLVSASIGATALSAYGQISAASYLSVWMTWWLGDAMGILIVTPFIVQWSRWPFANAREFYSWLALMAVLLATGGTIAALEAAHYSSLFFLLLPVMVVAAGHFGAAGATSTAMIMAALVLGMKHDVPAADWETSVKLAFVGSTAFAGYLIAAALASRRRSWYELAREQQRAWVTLRSIGDGVITADADGKADFINPAAERITGWPAVEARGMLVDQIFAPSPRGEWLHDKSGKLVPIESSVAEIRSPTGDISGRVISFRDVSEERRLQDELVYQANHDTLTGLHNRRTFERELLRLAESTHQPLPCALLYLDLDQFKVLNDNVRAWSG
jgi:integral membrane sensor domain MASE1